MAEQRHQVLQVVLSHRAAALGGAESVLEQLPLEGGNTDGNGLITRSSL